MVAALLRRAGTPSNAVVARSRSLNPSHGVASVDPRGAQRAANGWVNPSRCEVVVSSGAGARRFGFLHRR